MHAAAGCARKLAGALRAFALAHWTMLAAVALLPAAASAQSCPTSPPPSCGVDDQIAAGRWNADRASGSDGFNGSERYCEFEDHGTVVADYSPVSGTLSGTKLGGPDQIFLDIDCDGTVTGRGRERISGVIAKNEAVVEPVLCLDSPCDMARNVTIERTYDITGNVTGTGTGQLDLVMEKTRPVPTATLKLTWKMLRPGLSGRQRAIGQTRQQSRAAASQTEPGPEADPDTLRGSAPAAGLDRRIEVGQRLRQVAVTRGAKLAQRVGAQEVGIAAPVDHAPLFVYDHRDLAFDPAAGHLDPAVYREPVLFHCFNAFDPGHGVDKFRHCIGQVRCGVLLVAAQGRRGTGDCGQRKEGGQQQRGAFVDH